jgi:mandelamide amidase
VISDELEIPHLGIAEAVYLIATGEMSAERYAQRLIARHQALRFLNAITRADEERLLEGARAVDKLRRSGATLGPLGGVPVLIKDNIHVAEMTTAAGSPSLGRNVCVENAPIVQRLLDLGALLFGKANMHELAAGGTSSNPTTGAVANPYDPRRIAGGSSGGCAAGLAARIVPAALGTDTGGSVRAPAALCGVAGFRPSTQQSSLYSGAGVLPLASDLDSIGPMARTVADLALLHSAMTGRTLPEPYDLCGVRIGIPHRLYWDSIDPEVSEVAEEALARLRARDVTLVEVDVGGYYALASEVYGTLWVCGIKESLSRYLALIGAATDVDEVTAAIASRDVRALFERARQARPTAAQIEAARGRLRRMIQRAYREMFAAHGLSAILFPTQPMQAPFIAVDGDTEADEIEIDGTQVNKGLCFMRNTHVTAALAAPGLSIPAGLTRQGLPVGLELDGLNGKDEELLALGLAVECAWPATPAPQLNLS